MAGEIKHNYGPRVHILDNLYLNSILARFGHPDTFQPELNHLLHVLYTGLLTDVINNVFPSSQRQIDTRMRTYTEKGVVEGKFVNPETPVVTVDLARAGILPSHYLYEFLNHLMKPEKVRQDHFFMNRRTDASGQVVGVDVSGSKIGGGQEGAVVLFPDPMAATGGSIAYAINHYKDKVRGKAHRYVTMHLIVTPEYIKRMTKEHPDVEIYALRLDRAFSSQKALSSLPGTYPDEESGLNEMQYIVPGAGGIGELLNNSYE